ACLHAGPSRAAFSFSSVIAHSSRCERLARDRDAAPHGGAHMFSSSPFDWGLILLYFGFLAAVWLRLLGRSSTAVEYLVAGRRVTLPAFVATVVATWYGGILGVGEYSYRYGISNWRSEEHTSELQSRFDL